ncbi:hypothetical protein F0562_006006 [Nyssa sinensis]|uniref:Uncharacterized protein n=1 Tax=Nyssa sinensis TaxID=561372 RepID=A0A5J5APG8_9ASTE|nr:hypothetical protein F0562_006006 [Nyssa sinensis]
MKTSSSFEATGAMLSFEQFDFGKVLHDDSSSKIGESGEGGNIVKQTRLEDWGEMRANDLFCSDLRFYEDNKIEEGLLLSKYEQEQQLQHLSNFGTFDDLYLDIVSPPFQSCQEEITQLVGIQAENPESVDPNKEQPHAIPLASLGILKNYGNKIRRLKGAKINLPTYDTSYTKLCGQKLSTEEILRLAGEEFIQSSFQMIDDLSMISHPFSSSFSGLSDKEVKDVELVQYLLASAEKVGRQHFDRATKLLNRCDELSSNTGNPVQRVVYYFSEALREKIDRETEKIRSKDLVKKQPVDLEAEMMSPNLAIIAFHQEVPLSQVTQFTGMQAILENVAEAKKVHIIDLQIRSGMQWTVLMQALVARCECPVELLKITAVGTKSKPKIEETGKRLMSFAQSMNLPFSFNVVVVSDMLDLNEDLFDLETEEAVAVYSTFAFRNMIAQPDQLEYLIRAIRNINPCIMVVAEVEANLNSPVFVNRFVEALFFYGALFDCLEDCMDRNDPNRMISESKCCFDAIQNIVAAEGEDRTTRHVNINIWRAFFAGFGMTEIELSASSLYQAKLVVKNFSCGSSCTLDPNGKSLIIVLDSGSDIARGIADAFITVLLYRAQFMFGSQLDHLIRPSLISCFYSACIKHYCEVLYDNGFMIITCLFDA